MVKTVAFLVFDILDNIVDLVAMRDKSNQACEQAITPNVPHELVVVPERDVGRHVLFEEDHLHLSWS